MMSLNALRQQVPSIFAEVPHSRVSDRYNFVSTLDIVELMDRHGWSIASARQQAVRDGSRREFCKHVIRFQRNDTMLGKFRQVGDTIPQAVLTNSHDRSSATLWDMGLFVLACTNGLVLPSATIHSTRFPHREKWQDSVIEGVYEVLDELPLVADKVEMFNRLTLSPEQRLWYGEQALAIRWDDKPPVSAAQVVSPRRIADVGDSLWKTYQVTQENLIRGGLYGRNANNRRAYTRAVRGIDADNRINKELWRLTDEMSRILQ